MILTGVKSKKRWGHSENAVKIHLWIAIIAYLLVAYIKQTIKSDYSVYELIQILGVLVFDRTPIRELLTETTLQHCSQNDNKLLLFEN
ncbi:MAG: hypothetical protein LBR36_08295 [Bacteroidales bacterium]|nr:hypothetical protein [Bacteroidales bacterium]